MPTGDQEIVRTTAPAALPPKAPMTRDPKLDAACRDFEGLLLGFILKQGLNAKLDDDEEGDAGNNTAMLTDFAAEQTARELGRAGTLGIADMLYEQMSGQRTQSSRPMVSVKGAP